MLKVRLIWIFQLLKGKISKKMSGIGKNNVPLRPFKIMSNLLILREFQNE